MTDIRTREKGFFNTFSANTARVAGRAVSFVLALSIIFIWAVLGPFFGFSNTWQLVINTGTTIITFLMVFLIQNTQNRDSLAMNLKLDELLRVIKKARPSFIDLEDMSDDELKRLENEFKRLREQTGQ